MPPGFNAPSDGVIRSTVRAGNGTCSLAIFARHALLALFLSVVLTPLEGYPTASPQVSFGWYDTGTRVYSAG